MRPSGLEVVQVLALGHHQLSGLAPTYCQGRAAGSTLIPPWWTAARAWVRCDQLAITASSISVASVTTSTGLAVKCGFQAIL